MIKSIRLMGCLWMAVIGSGQLIAQEKKETQSPHIISIMDIDEEILQDFLQGNMKQSILEISEGAYLPLKLGLKGEWLALEATHAEPMFLKILQTCYVRCDEQDRFLFSTNQQQWKEFSEFFTGELKASFYVENQEPVVTFDLELNQRQTG